MSKYVVITESGCDVPKEFVQKHGVYVAPMHISFNGKTYDDGTVPPSEIFSHYEKTGELPKTSGCMPGDFIPLFDEINEAHPEAEVIYLAYSSVTTCSYESALIAVKGHPIESRFHAFDTRFASAGAAIIVEDVVSFLESKPDVEMDELEAFINDRIDRCRMAFIPGGLEFLRAGGRLSNTAYLGAQLLRIKPVIEFVDGKLVATKKLRGSMQKAVNKLVDECTENREPVDLGRVALIWNEGLEGSLRAEVEHRCRHLGFKQVNWIETGGVIASHSGPGSFGFVYYVKK